MKAIAIFFQGRKQDTLEVANQLIPALVQQGYDVRSIDSLYEGEETPDPLIKGCDLALVLGGDGTILHAARLCAFANLPIVAVNFGRVGFLTELEPAEVLEKLPHYLKQDGSIWVDKRIMLEATLDQDGIQEKFLALNDVVMARGMWPRMVQISIWIDDYYYNTTHADGIIVSTATGSTASPSGVRALAVCSAGSDSRFGLLFEDLPRCREVLASGTVEVVGFHVFSGSQVLDAAAVTSVESLLVAVRPSKGPLKVGARCRTFDWKLSSWACNVL